MNVSKVLGFGSWDPYEGISPEDHAAQQRRRRIVWLIIIVAGAVRLVLKILPA